MKALTPLLVALSLSVPSAASSEVVLAEEADRPVAAVVAARADFLGQVIRLSLPQGAPQADLGDVRRRIVERLGNSRQVKVFEGQWAWPPDAGKPRGGSSVQVGVFLPLTAEDASFLDAAQELGEVIAGLDLSKGKVHVEYLPVRLAVENAEQYRQRILESIRIEVEAAESRLGQGGRAVVSGLEGTVRARRSGELAVELYLDYRMSVEVPTVATPR